MRDRAVRTVVAIVLTATFATAGCKTAQTAARQGDEAWRLWTGTSDDFFEAAGVHFDDLKPHLPKIELPVTRAVGAIETLADRIHRRGDELKKVVCNDIFQYAVDSRFVPSQSEIVESLVSGGVPPGEASFAGAEIAAEVAANSQPWEEFVAFVGVLCDVDGALGQI